MPLDADDVLGSTYLDVADFEDRASMFGVSVALPEDDSILAAYLAAASRAVEAKTNKKFDPDIVYTEQHSWRADTRRISVDNPPISSVTDYRIYTGATTYASFSTTALFINSRENWIELSSLTAAGNLTSM